MSGCTIEKVVYRPDPKTFEHQEKREEAFEALSEGLHYIYLKGAESKDKGVYQLYRISKILKRGDKVVYQETE